MFELICEYLWCSRLITDLAGVRAELEPDCLPVTTAAGVYLRSYKRKLFVQECAATWLCRLAPLALERIV
jgi:hypothetical protein